jgi:hypothetical protein
MSAIDDLWAEMERSAKAAREVRQQHEQFTAGVKLPKRSRRAKPDPRTGKPSKRPFHPHRSR